MKTQITIRQATAEDLEPIRQLCRDYRTLLVERTSPVSDIAEAYYAHDAYEALMENLPELHARPDGFILAAILDDKVVGCAMTHRIDAEKTEIKRIFVAQSARGLGVAKQLCQAAMRQSKTDGYSRMVLDTVKELPEAIALYQQLGFVPAPAFYELNPKYKDQILFFGIDL